MTLVGCNTCIAFPVGQSTDRVFETLVVRWVYSAWAVVVQTIQSVAGQSKYTKFYLLRAPMGLRSCGSRSCELHFVSNCESQNNITCFSWLHSNNHFFYLYIYILFINFNNNQIVKFMYCLISKYLPCLSPPLTCTQYFRVSSTQAARHRVLTAITI